MTRTHRSQGDGFGGRAPERADELAFDAPYGPRTLGATTDRPEPSIHGQPSDHGEVAQAKDGAHAAGQAAPAPTGTGQPLDPGIRSTMESSFHTSFADVRVHQDGGAERLGAQAYAQGTDLHFASGAYAPSTEQGAALIGHELTHVQQQRAGVVAAPQGKGAAIAADPALEAEADDLGARAAAGESVTVRGSTSAATDASAAPVQAKLGTDFIRKAGAGKSLRSEEWKEIIRAIAVYDELLAAGTSEDSPEVLAALRRILATARAWLGKHQDDGARKQAKNARRTEIVERLIRRVEREVHRGQPRRRRGERQDAPPTVDVQAPDSAPPSANAPLAPAEDQVAPPAEDLGPIALEGGDEDGDGAELESESDASHEPDAVENVAAAPPPPVAPAPSEPASLAGNAPEASADRPPPAHAPPAPPSPAPLEERPATPAPGPEPASADMSLDQPLDQQASEPASGAEAAHSATGYVRSEELTDEQQVEISDEEEEETRRRIAAQEAEEKRRQAIVDKFTAKRLRKKAALAEAQAKIEVRERYGLPPDAFPDAAKPKKGAAKANDGANDNATLGDDNAFGSYITEGDLGGSYIQDFGSSYIQDVGSSYGQDSDGGDHDPDAPENMTRDHFEELVDLYTAPATLDMDDQAMIQRQVDEELGIVSRPDVQDWFSGEGLDRDVQDLQSNLRANSASLKEHDRGHAIERLPLTTNERVSTGWALLPLRSDYRELDRGENTPKTHFETAYLFNEGEDLALRAEQKLGTIQSNKRQETVIKYTGGLWKDADDNNLDTTEAAVLNQAVNERKMHLIAKRDRLAAEKAALTKDVPAEQVDPARLDDLIQRLAVLADKLKVKALNEHKSVRGRYIFAMNAGGEFFAAAAWEWVVHHSSFLAGGAVASAGEIMVENGRLTAISNQSGHYRPGPVYLWQAVKQLELLGCPLDDVEVKVVGLKSPFRSAHAFLAAMDPANDDSFFDSDHALRELGAALEQEKAQRRKARTS